MNAKEFTKACVRGGFAYENQAKIYVKRHPKESYSEDDCIALYHIHAWDDVERTIGSSYQYPRAEFRYVNSDERYEYLSEQYF